MGKFDDFLKAYTFDPATFNQETFTSEIEAAHADDLGIRDAKIQAVEAERDKAEETIQELKVKNYDLMMKIPATDAGNKAGNGENGNASTDVDDFFG